MQSSKRIENLHSQILGFPRVGNYSKPRVLKRRGVGGNPVIVAGIDEVGRGPLAGPVVAAAVVFFPKRNLRYLKFRLGNFGKLRDSKQLSFKQREKWYRLFLEDPNVLWGIGKVSEKTIDRINIHQATLLAMKRAVQNLSKKVRPHFLLVDGIAKIPMALPQRTIIKGDTKVRLCAAASIIAKVYRDRLMLRYHKTYSQYGFDRHKGYGSILHLAMLKKYGPCPIHRKTFSPISSLARLRNV
ncbi:ribonuclease HII [Patescibacteria group bacterium]|nr:ribonuclease HII [Patescibacteria group bacterium]